MIHIHWYPKSSEHGYEKTSFFTSRWKVRCRCGKIKWKGIDGSPMEYM